MILIKLGVILLMVAFAFLWNKHTAEKWSWVRQLGTTSLLVYWVHIELIYGRWLGAWHSSLSIGSALWQLSVMIVSMVLLSAARTHYNAVGRFPEFPGGRSRSGASFRRLIGRPTFSAKTRTMM